MAPKPKQPRETQSGGSYGQVSKKNHGWQKTCRWQKDLFAQICLRAQRTKELEQEQERHLLSQKVRWQRTLLSKVKAPRRWRFFYIDSLSRWR